MNTSIIISDSGDEVDPIIINQNNTDNGNGGKSTRYTPPPDVWDKPRGKILRSVYPERKLSYNEVSRILRECLI